MDYVIIKPEYFILKSLYRIKIDFISLTYNNFLVLSKRFSSTDNYINAVAGLLLH